MPFLVFAQVGFFLSLSVVWGQDLDFGLDDPDLGKKEIEDDDLSEFTGKTNKKKLPENLYFYATFDETFDAIQAGKDCFSSMTSVKAIYEDAPVGKGVVLRRETLSYPEEKGFPLREGTMAFWLKPYGIGFTVFGKSTRRDQARGELNSMRVGYGTYSREKSVPVLDVATTDSEGGMGRSGLQADMPIWKPGMWKHVAVVWSRAGFQIWVDGEKLAEYDEGAYTPDENAKSFDLNPGRSIITIDDFRVYSIKLQEHEIKALVGMADTKVIRAAKLEAAKSIGSESVVFFDRRSIDEMEGVRLVLHHPRPAEAALRLNKPWEGPFSFGFTAFRHEGKYRLYYRTAGAARETMVMCCAESDDGIRWTKPDFRAAKYKGTKSNNLIADEQGRPIPNLHVFQDAGPASASGRIKGFYFQRAESFRDFIQNERGLLRAVFLTSHDGVTFRRMSNQPRMLCNAPETTETFATMFWSEAEKAYVCTYRSWNGVHTLTRTTSVDFVRWSRPRGSMGFGSGDPWHIWTSGMAPYPRSPEVYVSLAGRVRPGVQVLTQEQAGTLRIAGQPASSLWEDSSDCVFMTSEPGSMVCTREFKEPLVSSGMDPQNGILGSNFPVQGLIETGPDEYSFFLSRQYAQPGWHLQRFIVRKDGFVSAHADAEGGHLIVKPLRFTGHRLELNCVVGPAGSIRVGIEDASGEAKMIPGFALEDCLPLSGDTLSQTVRWKGGRDLRALAGKVAARLHFTLKNADLYSFRFGAGD